MAKLIWKKLGCKRPSFLFYTGKILLSSANLYCIQMTTNGQCFNVIYNAGMKSKVPVNAYIVVAALKSQQSACSKFHANRKTFTFS